MDSKENCKEKEFQETLKWLFAQLPMFSRLGAAAYKPGLDTSIELDEFLGSPHRKFKSIHVGGTNGKGSTSHILASILQSQGYKVGLYTSPHLVDFRERIKINGEMIPKEAVVGFIQRWKANDFRRDPSFFELTMMMAFDWFAKEKVDYAVIEVGMGGRLDSTNIISPVLSVITNISKDHVQFLGDTLEKIAYEKAGIIKPGIPVIIGEREKETEQVFIERAAEVGAPLRFASDETYIEDALSTIGGWRCQSKKYGELELPLGGDYQLRNIFTVLTTVDELGKEGVVISEESVREGIKNVVANTGLRGRWQIISKSPLTICDTGHNFAGINYNVSQLKKLKSETDGKLRMLIGFVNDKDVSQIVNLFPQDAEYYFTQASVPRAMPVEELEKIFNSHGIRGKTFPTVLEAEKALVSESTKHDILFIGGSTFIVADYLATTRRGQDRLR